MNWCRALPLLGLLCLHAHTATAQPEPERGPEPFGLGLVQADHLATMVLGSAFDPQTRGFGVATNLLVGTLPDDRFRVWEIVPPTEAPRFRQAAGAATAFLAGAAGTGNESLAALNVLEILDLGDGNRFNIWTLRDTTQIEKIPRIDLDRVKDGQGIPKLDSDDRELDAYFGMVIAASRTPEKVLEEGALKDISYANLFDTPKDFRGEVVQVIGKLKRIRKFPAGALLKDAGIPFLYEGWIFDPGIGANPFCVVFSELPKGSKVAESMEIPVQFTGYFYKKYRYVPAEQAAGKPNMRREAPLLIGRTFVATGEGKIVDPEKDDPGWWIREFLPYFVGGVVVMVTTGFIILLWFRRGDAAVRKRLRALEPRELILPEPEPAGQITGGNPGTNPGPAERN
jgi:hypothetical protein